MGEGTQANVQTKTPEVKERLWNILFCLIAYDQKESIIQEKNCNTRERLIRSAKYSLFRHRKCVEKLERFLLEHEERKIQ